MKNIVAVVILLALGTFGGFQRNGKLTTDLSAAIKGVAAILIVLTHTVPYSMDSLFIESLRTGWLSVAVFFFLSGFGSAFGLSQKTGYTKHFLRNRFVRVCVPLLLANAVYTVYHVLVLNDFHLDTPERVLKAQTIVPFTWYPIVALFFYLFIWTAFRISKRALCRITVLSVLVIVYTFVWWRLVGATYDFWFISNFAFVLGAALAMFDPQLQYRKYILPVSVLCSIGGFAIFPLSNRLFGTNVYPAYILSCNFGSGFLSLALILLLTITGKSNRVTSFLGKISYEVYLYHGLFLWIFRDLVQLPSWWLVFICTTTAVIPFATLMHIPDEFFVKRLCKRTQSAASAVLTSGSEADVQQK